MWKIRKVSLENFKFFKDEFTLNLEGKNLLLYGENGSGKSSIYWGLYTLFQSVYKEPVPDQAMKYFLADSSENLRNKFSSHDEYSGIKVTFTESGRDYIMEDSSVRCNTHCPGDGFMNISSAASDFMNYKFLSAIFDFKNSQLPEIFHIFETDVLPTLIFSPSVHLVHTDGTNPENFQDNADYWWKYLQNQYTCLPKAKNPKSILKTSPEMIRYKSLLDEFNRQISYQLAALARRTNQKLTDSFRVPASISFSYIPAHIAKVIPHAGYNFTSKLVRPQIHVKAHFNHDLLDEANREVLHPRSFFNEAKLTSIALAIRLSIAEMKMDADALGAKVLLVDDLLISLDMSNRMVVVDYLLKLVGRYQMLIFTHDKAFFTLIKRRIEAKYSLDDWKTFKLYASENLETGIPTPLLFPTSSLLDEARCFFTACNYAACANTLRRDAEFLFQNLLPHDTIYPGGQERPIMLHEMIKEAKAYFQAIRLDSSLLDNLNFYREFLLNPMSHGDSRTEVYKSELIQIINDLKVLHSIGRSDRITLDDCNSMQEYQIAISNGNKGHVVRFYFREPWPVYHFNSQDYYHRYINVSITYADFMTIDPNKLPTSTIGKLYTKMCKNLFGDSSELYPELKDVITKM